MLNEVVDNSEAPLFRAFPHSYLLKGWHAKAGRRVAYLTGKKMVVQDGRRHTNNSKTTCFTSISDYQRTLRCLPVKVKQLVLLS